MISKLPYTLILFLLASCASQRGSKDSRTNLVLSYAKSFLGSPYQYGGLSRKGIDCSGLIYLAYNQAGVKMPRTAEAQSKIGKAVSYKQLSPGDLVFFRLSKGGSTWWHAGIISETNNNGVKFLHASTSRGVVESSLEDDYYWDSIQSLRRVL
jgi:cell wall-associated NlpC family hydrolase